MLMLRELFLVLFLLLPSQLVFSQPYDFILKQFVDHPFISVDFTYIDDSKWFTIKTEANQFVKDTILLVSIPQVAGTDPAVVRMQQPTTLNADKTVTFSMRVVQPNDSYCSRQFGYNPKHLAPLQVAWMVIEVGAYNISGSTFIAGKGSLGRKSWSTTATFTNGNLYAIWFPTGCVSSTDFCVLNHASRGAINLLQTNNNVKDVGKVLYLSVRSKAIDLRRGQWVLVPHDVAAGVLDYHVLANETLGYLAFPTGSKIACLEKMVLQTFTQLTNYIEQTQPYGITYDYPPGLFGMVGSITSLCDTILKSSNWLTTSGTFAIYEDQCAKTEIRHTTFETIYLMVVGEQQSSGSTYECKVNFNSALDPTSAPTRFPTFTPSCKPSFVPTFSPSVLPTFRPSTCPSVSPSSVPTFRPSVSPTFVPSVNPTFNPSTSPSFSPSSAPTFRPSVSPTFVPSVNPTFNPSTSPSFSPSSAPTLEPSVNPTFNPSTVPTLDPSSLPTFSPTLSPTGGPTPYPTFMPSVVPSTSPTFVPSVEPSTSPSASPTFVPSVEPSTSPSSSPTFVPSVEPSTSPSSSPTFVPSVNPSSNPSSSPTFVPSVNPSSNPSSSPTFTPSLSPTGGPTYYPTFFPSHNPSSNPTFSPTVNPSVNPSSSPSFSPSRVPTFMPSVTPSTSPSNSPTLTPSTCPSQLPSRSPTFSPSTVPSLVPSKTPTFSPTFRPTFDQYCLSVFLWDSFGDYWDNLQFVIRANDGSFEYIFHKTCNCSDVFTVCFESSNVDFNMTIEVIDPSKPVRHGWEAFFKYVDPVTGITYYGQQGSIVRIRDTDVIYTYDLVNTNPEAEENQCERCEHPPKPKPSNGGDDSKPSSPRQPPSPTASPITRRVLGHSPNESDDGKGSEPGPGAGNGKGNGNGKGAGGDDKPKRPPLKLPFALFDGEGDGWYRGGNGTDQMCPGVPESSMPSVITYPKYSIVSGDRTTLIHEGTICGSFSTEACVEVLPYDGKFVFRVAGFAEDPDEVRWDFCGESGILGEELQFQMVKGKCVAVEKRSADDYCQGIESISVWSGSMMLQGSSPFSSSSLSVADSKVLERALSEVLFNSEVRIVSVVAGEDGGLVVSFTALIIMEELGYVGVYSDEAESAEEFIENSMENSMSTGVVLVSLQDVLYNDPSLSSEVVGQTTSLTLLGFEMTSLSYRTKVSSNNNGANDNGAQDGINNKNSEGESDGVMKELSHISLVGYLAGGVGLVMVGILVAVYFNLKKSKAPLSRLPISDFPERSSHSLLEQSEDSMKYEGDVFTSRLR